MSKDINGRISMVAEDSPAHNAGLKSGDELISINAQPVCDILDYHYISAEDHLEIKARRNGRVLTYSIEKETDEALGLEFEEDLFDGVRTCANNCVFCFLHQMPKGLRQSLYVRDDDFRLSFAHGNYITLTNLSDDDMDRICTQRMSTLYVSVHTTDPALRVKMLGNKQAARIMDQLRRLADSRITMHAQIVLCPGINDGEHLEKTIRDLSSLHPWVASVAIVPVGLTKHRDGLTPLHSVNSRMAYTIIEACKQWQAEFKKRLGTRFIFPSDELYILSKTEIPSKNSYEGFPQLEDGIGISRIFLDELRHIAKESIPPGSYVLVIGVLAMPLVQQLADILAKSPGVSARICVIKNKFLGETVTVAGLLAGQDIAKALVDVKKDETVLIPNVALNEDRFLDDMTISDLQKLVEGKITVVPTYPIDMVKTLQHRSKQIA